MELEKYYDFNLINKHSQLSNTKNYHLKYLDPKFTEEQFIKNKYYWTFEHTFDIEIPQVKEYMIRHPKKFKTMCLVNIYLSKIIKGKQFNIFHNTEYDYVFKDYSSKYIDNSIILLNTKDFNMRLETFDTIYNKMFENCNKKHRKSQKCKLKKEYNKYLQCNDIEQCNLKDLLYMFIAYVELSEQSLHSSHSSDSLSSGVST